ncbi:MAG: leucine-rich repeat domain-containing protein [Saprospiraceae bacterium]|nr:leucine-rich repeat domain-containing protein [Saprospiraceae bacterium]
MKITTNIYFWAITIGLTIGFILLLSPSDFFIYTTQSSRKYWDPDAPKPDYVYVSAVAAYYPLDCKVLDLSAKKIEEFPKELLKLKELEKLILYNNQLSELPAEITQLKNLKHLNLAQNKFLQLPKELTELDRLEELLLHNNQINTLLHLPTSLKRLNLANNNVRSKDLILIPKTLEYLNLYRNKMANLALPNHGEGLALKELNLADNNLEGFPSGVHKAPLVSLNLDKNDIKYLPIYISSLTQLRKLSLNNNRLKMPSFSNYQDSDYIAGHDTIGNQKNFYAVSIPESIGQLKNLDTLNLRFNHLGSLPSVMKELPLKHIELRGNMFDNTHKVEQQVRKLLKNASAVKF